MELIAPRPGDHLEDLSDVFARTFSGYWDQVAFARGGYIGESTYDWSASRVGVVDGRIVTHFGVWDFGMRIGGEVVRVAGIGAVATLQTHRKQGLMAQTAGSAVNGLHDAGYDLSLLFGIPDFYHRFGYITAFGQIRTTLKTADVRPGPEVSYERYDGPVTALADLYNRENEGITGTYVRPTYRTNRMPATFTVYRFADGYLVGGRDGNSWQVADCAGDPRVVVEIARRCAAEAICPEIEFVYFPPRSRVGEYLQTITHRTVIDRHPGGGPMLKTVNLHRTLTRIAPELGRRLASSPMSGYAGTLLLKGDSNAVLLDFRSGEVGDVRKADAGSSADGRVIAGTALGRLVIGDGDPRRICRQSGVELEGDAHDLVPVLFPDQEPSTIYWDRF